MYSIYASVVVLWSRINGRYSIKSVSAINMVIIENIRVFSFSFANVVPEPGESCVGAAVV